jgi:Dockerin type I domain
MNAYFTRLKSCLPSSLLLVLGLLCFGSQTASAQIPAACGKSALYYYDLFGNWTAPAVTPKLIGGSMDGVLLAEAMTNSSPKGKFTGISSGLITFSIPATATTPATEEYYVYSTGVFSVARTGVFLPEHDAPTAAIPKVATPALGVLSPVTTHAGEKMDATNPNFIDLDGYFALMLDADGSLSEYDYVTGKYIGGLYDPTWKTFTGGSLAGLTPSKHSAANPTGTIDGAEGALLWHMNPLGNSGAGIMEYYDLATGTFQANIYPCLGSATAGPVSFGTFSGGALGVVGATPAVTYKDAIGAGIGGKVVGRPNITYLGINLAGAYFMTFYDASAGPNGRILYYDAALCFPPSNTYAAFEPTSITPNALTPNSGPRVLADVLNPAKFLGVGFNELSFIDTKGTFEAFISNSPTAPGFTSVSYLPNYCFTTWDGPQAGKVIGDKCSNPNLLGMNDWNYVMKDANGTLSYYSFLGVLLADYCVTNYGAGGIKGGQLITDMSNVLATEDGYVYALAANGGVDVYISSTGAFVVNWPAAAALKGGPLDGKTLKNAVKAIPCGLTGAGSGTGVEGATYVGTDNGYQVFAVCEEDIKATKALVSAVADPAVSGQGLATYEIIIENTGGVALTPITAVDNLASQFLACSAGAVPSPVVTAVSGTPILPTANTGFTGAGAATNLLIGTDGTLKPKDKIKITFTAKINLACGIALPVNVATVGGTGSSAVSALTTAPVGATGLAACTSIATGTTGPDQVICPRQTATLVPPVGVPGAWAGGAGSFAGNVYTPAASEYGTTFTLTFKPAPALGVCSLYDLTTVIKIDPVPASLVCEGNINLTLASPSCSTTITPDMMFKNPPGGCYGFGNYTIKLETSAGVLIPGNTVTSALVGKTIRVSITNANNGSTCWGNMTIEDKSPPVVVAPGNITLLCNATDISPTRTGTVPADKSAGTTPRTWNAAGTALAGNITAGSVTDCSGVVSTFYTDVESNVKCDGSKTITRSWFAKDVYGMVSTVGAVQTIVLVRPFFASLTARLATILPANVTIACTDAVPTALGTSSTVCGITSSQLGVDMRVNLCGNTYKIVRTYQVIDACPGGSPGMDMTTGVQVITVVDPRTPKLTVSGTSYPTPAAPVYTVCGADYPSVKVRATAVSVEAGDAGDLVDYAARLGASGVSTGAVAITAWGDAAMCGMGRFTLNVASSDNCANGSIASNDSRFPVVGGVISGTVMGNTTFNVVATDACGNTTTIAVTVNVIDNISPTAICDGVTATLNNYKEAVITGASFNHSSNDNCGIVRIVVAKAVGTDVPSAWCDNVKFGCADANVTGLKVWVRYIDAAGNYTDCCVPVNIVDKATVACSDASPIDVFCTDVRLNNLDGLFGTPSSFYDGCSTPVVSTTTDNSGISCGAGKIVRTTKFTITNSLGTQSVSCSQAINITATRGFRVKELADAQTTCVGTYNLEADRQQVIKNLQLLYAEPSNNLVTIADPSTPGGLRVTKVLISSTSAAPGTTAAYTRFNYGNGAIGGVPGPSAAYSGPRGIDTWETTTTIAPIDGASPVQNINATQEMIAGSPTCAAPVVEATDWFYSNSEFCKIYVQVFTIKDVCDFSNDNSTTTFGVPISNVGTFTLPKAGLSDTLYTPTLPQDGVFQSTIVNGKHIIRFTRTIKVLDKTAPTSTAPANIAICDGDAKDTDADGCEFGFSTTIAGVDNCGAVSSGSALFYTWSIANSSAATVLSGTGTTVAVNNLGFGEYKVTYRVADYCGNISNEYSFKVSGKDCKAPEILVHNKLVELAGQIGSGTGMARLFYADIRNRITDNCTGDLTTSNKIVIERGGVTTATSPVTSSTTTLTDGVMFSCLDANTIQKVRVWAVDGSGNWNYAVSDITVQDNIGICTLRPIIAGTIGTENGSPVKDVVVSASTSGAVAASTTAAIANGTTSYVVTGLAVGTNYQVRADKTIDTDKKNGVTTLDIALISKHLLGETELNSAYKIIAADVDKNGEVDATDMLHIRRFILGITANLPAGSAWRFIDKAYAFRNASNPLGEDFPEVVSLSSVPAGMNAANFMAVKLGDVNNSFDATTVRGSRALAFTANDMDVVAGNEYTVAINAENINAAAFQGTFSFDGAKVKAVKAGNLNNVSDNNFNMSNTAVAASWNGKSEGSTTVANITFVATKSGKLSEMLTVNSAITLAEGYDAAGNAMNVTLKFNTGKVAGGEFALYQNTPNPVALSTKIGFNLPKDGQAKLTVYTAEGKVLSVINNGYKAGYNEISINKSDLNATGMLYYRLDTQDNSSTRKMIIIE